jgi:hypothetical protein
MATLILFAASLLGGYLFPWWWPAIAAYAVGYWLPKRPWSAFIAGFAGTALAWGAMAGFLDWRNHHILSDRIAQLFSLPTGLLLPPITALLGGLMGGMGAWAGYALRAYLKPRVPGNAAEAAGADSAGAVSAAGSEEPSPGV